MEEDSFFSFFFFFSKLARMKGRGIKSMVTIILWLAMIGGWKLLFTPQPAGGGLVERVM
jgi:hypothetical protein